MKSLTAELFHTFSLIQTESLILNIYFLMAGLFAVYLGLETQPRLNRLDIKDVIQEMNLLEILNQTELHNKLPYPYNDLNSLHRKLYRVTHHTVVYGSGLFIVSIFGVTAVLFQKWPITFTYLVVLFGFQLFGIFTTFYIISSTNADYLENLGSHVLWEFIDMYNKDASPYTKDYSIYLEAIQLKLKCCGYESSFDFVVRSKSDKNNRTIKDHKLPFSCCKGYGVQDIRKSIIALRNVTLNVKENGHHLHTNCTKGNVTRLCKHAKKIINDVIQLTGPFAVVITSLSSIFLILTLLSGYLGFLQRLSSSSTKTAEQARK